MRGHALHVLGVVCLVAAFDACVAGDFAVPPFFRALQLTSPPTNGTDVFILQNLLRRVAPKFKDLPTDSSFGSATAKALLELQLRSHLPGTGVLDAVSARAVLEQLSEDGYVDDGRTAGEQGYLYKVFIPVYRNRSIETEGSLFNAAGQHVLNFTARTHGIVFGGNNTWPSFNSSGFGLNSFSSSGNTPTGLFKLDLNSPEDIPREFGPYPVNRVVQGLAGNGAWLVPNIRDGLLIHTGEWAQYSPWHPPLPMPNSHGCIHTWPHSVYDIWQRLTLDMGVKVRPNTNGALPYPYKSQGLLSVQLMD